jgi:LysR family nitrogen assimilation transcriptional regulator
MELRQLRYFVKIADMGSISRASRALHISQPSLSQQIAQLEDEVGKALLNRAPSGVSMTVEGETFYRHALQILRQTDELKGIVKNAHAQLTGRLSLTLVHTQAMQYGLPLLLKLREQYPGIDVELFDNTSSDALQGLASGRRELGMLVNGQDAALLDSEPVFEEELLLVSHPDQAPAGKCIALSDLARLPLILPRRSQLGEELGGLDSTVGGGGYEAARRSSKMMLANSVAVFRQAVLAGAAHALQPWGAVREDLQRGAMKATAIEPAITRTVFISTARGAITSQAVRAVRQVLLSVVREEHEHGHVKGRLLGSLAPPMD